VHVCGALLPVEVDSFTPWRRGANRAGPWCISPLAAAAAAAARTPSPSITEHQPRWPTTLLTASRQRTFRTEQPIFHAYSRPDRTTVERPQTHTHKRSEWECCAGGCVVRVMRTWSVVAPSSLAPGWLKKKLDDLCVRHTRTSHRCEAQPSVDHYRVRVGGLRRASLSLIRLK
jgi:hypothetical protein